jgi:hypothetical protein
VLFEQACTSGVRQPLIEPGKQSGSADEDPPAEALVREIPLLDLLEDEPFADTEGTNSECSTYDLRSSAALVLASSNVCLVPRA